MPKLLSTDPGFVLHFFSPRFAIEHLERQLRGISHTDALGGKVRVLPKHSRHDVELAWSDAEIAAHLPKAFCFFNFLWIHRHLVGDATAWHPVHSKTAKDIYGNKYFYRMVRSLLQLGYLEKDDDFTVEEKRGEQVIVKGESKKYRAAEAYRTGYRKTPCTSIVFQRHLLKFRDDREKERTGDERRLRAMLSTFTFANPPATKLWCLDRLFATYKGLESREQVEDWTEHAERTDKVMRVHSKGVYPDTPAGHREKRRDAKMREMRMQWLILGEFHYYKKTWAQFQQDCRDWSVPLLKRFEKLYTLGRYDADRVAIHRILSGDWFCETDEYGRIHHNLSSLSRELRSHLVNWQHPGRALVMLDVANSQPLVLAALMIHHAGGRRRLSRTQLKYVEHCEAGVLYERMMRALGIAPAHRPLAKVKAFGEIFFGENKYDTAAKRWFTAEYPDVADFIHDQKLTDYRDLPRGMQTLESDVIIKGIARQLYQLDILFVTIHDAVFIAARSDWEVELVIETMVTEFREEYEVTPKIKTETIGEASEPTCEESAVAEVLTPIPPAHQTENAIYEATLAKAADRLGRVIRHERDAWVNGELVLTQAKGEGGWEYHLCLAEHASLTRLREVPAAEPIFTFAMAA